MDPVPGRTAAPEVAPVVPPTAARGWWWRPQEVAWVAWGAAGALLLGLDGSAGWRVARILLVLAVAAGCLGLARRRSGWSVPVGLLAGALGLAVGGAIGARDVLGDGTPARASAALVLAGAGVVLVVGASAELLHHVPRWWRLAVIPALVVAVAMVAFVVAPGVAATNLPALPDGPRTPDDVGITATDVRFASADGVELAAWWVPSANGATVVLRHGAGSTRDDVLGQLAVLARAGFGVLATDARGHGDSGGRAMDLGWYGDLDLDAALTWLAGQPGVDLGRLALVGLSMGGEEAVGMAADRRVRGVVAEGVTGRTDADKSWLDAYGLRGEVQRGIEWLQTRVTDLLTAASPPTPLATAVARSDVPILLVSADLVDEERAADALRAVAPDRVQVWVVGGAGHTDGLATAPGEWEERVVGFLRQATGTG